MANERVLGLEGAPNFRDLGGYPTNDGKQLKWRRLYRAGILGALSNADCDRMAALGLRSICDLRSTGERERGPQQWSKIQGVNFWTRDYTHSSANLHALLKSNIATVDEARAAMIDVYRVMPTEQAPSYRELFRMLADGELPLAFNCSAGKDRTGLAAALVLTILDVPHDIILEDYMMSSTTFVVPREQRAAMIGCAPEVSEVMRGTDPRFMEAAFAVINDRHGSVAGYLRAALQVTDEMQDRIRGHLLEDAV